MEECYQTINMSANQSNPRRRGNTDIKWTAVVVVVYFNKTKTFSSFEKESVGSTQFKDRDHNMMLPVKFVPIFTPRYLTLIWLSQQVIVFINLSYRTIFKSPSNSRSTMFFNSLAQKLFLSEG